MRYRSIPFLFRMTCSILFFASCSAPSFAQVLSVEERAQNMLGEANRLYDNRLFDKACPMYEEIAQMSQGLAARIALGDCYRDSWRLVDAYRVYERVVKDAPHVAREGSSREAREAAPLREIEARDRMEALKTKLSWLTIRVPEIVRDLPGFEVLCDGRPVHSDEWGTQLPVFPGSHQVVARATGKKRFERNIDVRMAGDLAEVAIGLLESDDPVRVEHSVKVPASAGWRIGAIVLGAAGVAALAGGTYYGLSALENKAASDVIDELTIDSGGGCTTGNPGLCSPGIKVCTGGKLECYPLVNPTAEVCNNKDDNCDGETDNNAVGTGIACNTGAFGVCGLGTQSCVNGVMQCAPNEEKSADVCDGKDNDCNPVTADGSAEIGMPCDTGQKGECAAGAGKSCVVGNLECTPIKQASVELCDTPEDESCDGIGGCTGEHKISGSFGGVGVQKGTAVAFDAAGNVYVAGDMIGSVTFGGNALLADGTDVFVAKFDSSGKHIWSYKYGGPYDQYSQGLALDSMGNIFLLGGFENSILVGNTSLQSVGGKDVFIAKLNINGTPVWTQHLGGAGQEQGAAITVDALGNAIFTGSIDGGASIFNVAMVGNGGTDIFAAKLSPNGVPLWAKTFGDVSNQEGSDVAMSGGSDFLLTGNLGGSADFGGGSLMSGGDADIFLAKFDVNGNHVWSKGFPAAQDQYAKSLVVDVVGDAVVTGAFNGAVNFGGGVLTSGGATDVFVAKFGPGGNHILSKRFGDSSPQGGYGVATDYAGNIIIVGDASGAVDFGGGAPVSPNVADVFVLKLDVNGIHQWSKLYGDAQSQHAHSVAASPLGNIAFTGDFLGSINFGGAVFGPVNNGGSDIFLAILAP